MFRNKKNIWIIPVYGILYMVSFILVEKKDAKLHIVHSVIDDYIPFCEYFIIPYVLVFVCCLCFMLFCVRSGRKKGI